MAKTKTITVPQDVWDTAFACFAGSVGARMDNYSTMPENWQRVFRFACDDAALARLGISREPPQQNRGE